MSTTSRASVLLCLFAPGVLAATSFPGPGDPFADPKNDPYNPLRYIASNVLTGIAFGKLKHFPKRFLLIDWLSSHLIGWPGTNMVCDALGSEMDVVHGHWMLQ